MHPAKHAERMGISIVHSLTLPGATSGWTKRLSVGLARTAVPGSGLRKRCRGTKPQKPPPRESRLHVCSGAGVLRACKTADGCH